MRKPDISLKTTVAELSLDKNDFRVRPGFHWFTLLYFTDI